MQYRASVPIDKLRPLLCSLVNDIRRDKLKSGVEYDGHTYDTDDVSVANITAVVSAIAAGISPETITWRTADNVSVSHSQSSISGLAASMLAHQQAIYGRSFELKDEINESENPQLINLQSGW
jgi:hypothetical protein